MMAKRITKGVGMKERVVIQRDASDFPDRDSFANAFFEALEANCIAGNVRAENERRCRAILKSVGLKQGDIESVRRLMEYGEDSAVRLADEWLTSFHRVKSLEIKIADGQVSEIARLIDEAEQLGIIQERMWWRAGIDPISGEKRESLALTGRPVKRGQKDAAAITNSAHAPRREARFGRMMELVPSVGIENAARQCEAEGLGGWQGIRRQWDRFKEKPDR
jgi:hypothetical protein